MEDISVEDICEFLAPYHNNLDIFAINNKCNNIYQNIQITLKNKPILNILNINGFKNENRQIILDEINRWSLRKSSILRSWNEMFIFLKLYYNVIDGTLTDKLYLLNYCYDSSMIRFYMDYNRFRFKGTTFREILNPKINVSPYYCVNEIIYNKLNNIISHDIILLNKKIEEQKNNMVILDYIMNNERNITEKGVRNIVLDFIFPSLKKTIPIHEEIKYKVLLEEKI